MFRLQRAPSASGDDAVPENLSLTMLSRTLFPTRIVNAGHVPAVGTTDIHCAPSRLERQLNPIAIVGSLVSAKVQGLSHLHQQHTAANPRLESPVVGHPTNTGPTQGNSLNDVKGRPHFVCAAATWLSWRRSVGRPCELGGTGRRSCARRWRSLVSTRTRTQRVWFRSCADGVTPNAWR